VLASACVCLRVHRASACACLCALVCACVRLCALASAGVCLRVLACACVSLRVFASACVLPGLSPPVQHALAPPVLTGSWCLVLLPRSSSEPRRGLPIARSRSRGGLATQLVVLLLCNSGQAPRHQSWRRSYEGVCASGIGHAEHLWQRTSS